uniref:Phospholipase A2 n=1 Tax=Nothoprocta perdicaria TaxID=30464 RepID=A0A8C6ZKY2_NOTPE
MKNLLVFAVLLVCGKCLPWGVLAAHGSLWELQRMVTQATGHSALLHYGSYGCHCGWGGRGQPKDATDGCCQRHDSCYESLLRHGCQAKRQRYRYGCTSIKAECIVRFFTCQALYSSTRAALYYFYFHQTYCRTKALFCTIVQACSSPAPPVLKAKFCSFYVLKASDKQSTSLLLAA